MSAIKTISQSVQVSRKQTGTITIHMTKYEETGHFWYQLTLSETKDLPKFGSQECMEMLKQLASKVRSEITGEKHPVICLDQTCKDPSGSLHWQSFGPYLRKEGCVVTLPGCKGQVITQWPHREGEQPKLNRIGIPFTPALLQDLS